MISLLRHGMVMFFQNQRIGKYQIIDTIGTGGFGSVYLAKDVLIDKKVAIKVPHKQGEDTEKLLREPRLLAALNHPNIVTVITAEKTNDIFFIVMEYVDGPSLEQYLRKHKPLPIDQALDWFIQIGEAIAYAHSKNIIHRDIRPANVLLSTDGVLKLADLGTSRYMEDNPFAATRIGSPPYMAPEHFQGKATLQSDIYSFGILMYESITGRLPFFDKNPRRLAQIAREGNAPAAHHLNNQVPHELSVIVGRAMHRMLGSRYQTAQEVVKDLKRVNKQLLAGPSQDLSYLVEHEPKPPKKIPISREITTKELSNLFCWNCSRPIQRRTQTCPHCNVSLK